MLLNRNECLFKHLFFDINHNRKIHLVKFVYSNDIAYFWDYKARYLNEKNEGYYYYWEI